jgi:hypothetical protein
MSKRKRSNYICLKDIEDDLIEALINKVHIRIEMWDRNNPAYKKNNHESHRIFDEINRELTLCVPQEMIHKSEFLFYFILPLFRRMETSSQTPKLHESPIKCKL